MSRHVALLIEDDPKTAEEIVDLLLAIGHGVIHVTTKRALDMLDQVEFCYVLLDLESLDLLTERTSVGARIEAGQTLLREVRGRFEARTIDGRHHFLPILILIVRGHSEHNTAVNGIVNGANAFVTKPLAHNAELTANVYECLDKAGRATHEHCPIATARAKGLPAGSGQTPTAPSESEGPRVNSNPTLVREGASIRIEFGGQRAVFAPLEGFSDLAILLLREGEDVSANELFTRRARAGLYSTTDVDEATPESPGAAGGPGRDSDPVFDEEALRGIRESIARLRAEGTVEAIEQAEELEKRYLKPALDVRGRARGLGSPSKSARVAIQKRIKKALELIRRDLPELYEHLGGEQIFAHRKSSPVALHVGSFCSYKPREPMKWDVRL